MICWIKNGLQSSLKMNFEGFFQFQELIMFILEQNNSSTSSHHIDL